MKKSSIILLTLLAFGQCEIPSSECKQIESKLKYLDELIQQFNSMKWRQEENEKTIRVMETKIKDQSENEDKIRKLEEQVLLQDKRIKQLELKSTNSFMKDFRDNQTVKKQTFARQRNDSRENNTRSRETNISTTTSFNHHNDVKKQIEPSVKNVAFYSYMKTMERNPGPHHILVFDVVTTNVGSGYNNFNGMFKVPSYGAYVFSWTVFSDEHSVIHTQLMRNNYAIANILTESQDISEFHTATGMVVAEVSKGDIIYIRTHPTAFITGSIASDMYKHSSFCGWKLF